MALFCNSLRVSSPGGSFDLAIWFKEAQWGTKPIKGFVVGFQSIAKSRGARPNGCRLGWGGGQGSLRASNAPANAWMFRNFDNTFVICPVTVARPLSCNMSQPGRGKQNLPTYSQKVPLSKITKTVLPFTKQIEHMCLAAPTENVLIPNFGPHVRHVRGIVGHDS